jgi:hypothetical protein
MDGRSEHEVLNKKYLNQNWEGKARKRHKMKLGLVGGVKRVINE